MTKLEEIARAIWAKTVDYPDDEAWANIQSMEEGRLAFQQARAAVVAIREPSEAILQQFISVQYGVYGDVEAKAIFQKMIDAILNEKPE